MESRKLYHGPSLPRPHARLSYLPTFLVLEATPDMSSLNLPKHVPLAASFRGGHPENVHHGSVAVTDTSGRLLMALGDVNAPVFTRSALKPFQAMPLLAATGDLWGLSDAEVALLCSSHSGEPRHTALVQALLARLGVDETALGCGTHVPYFYAATGQIAPPEGRYSRLQHNCSGNHSAMLLLTKSLGQALADYLRPEGAAQQAILRCVGHFTGMTADGLPQGIDGCGAPNVALPLQALATAYARLTLTTPDPVYGEAPGRIVRAMTTHPELVSGQGRTDLQLAQAGRGDWLCKAGADGVQVLVSVRRGVAIAAKASDGMAAPLMVALTPLLDRLGWLDEKANAFLAALQAPALRSAAGRVVGELRAVWPETTATEIARVQAR